MTTITTKDGTHPGGLPREAFDGIRAGVLADRSQFFKDLTVLDPQGPDQRGSARVLQGVAVRLRR